MLIELFGRNFRCFRDEFRLSMLAADIDPGNDRGIIEVPLEGEDEPLRLLRCVGIYGPNASGKSTVLLAAEVLGGLIATSAGTPSNEPIEAYQPFMLDQETASRPVVLGARAIIDRREYEYTAEFDAERFLLERLIDATEEEPTVLFDRRADSVEGEWTKQAGFELAKEFGIAGNVLLLSVADKLMTRLDRGIAVKLRSLLEKSITLGARNVTNVVAEIAHRDREGFGIWLKQWLRHADLGVAEYELEELPDSAESQPGRSVAQKTRKPRFRFWLRHTGPSELRSLPFEWESAGTRRFVELAPVFHWLLHGTGGEAYWVDELGESLHPELLRTLMREFNEAPPERVRGQLIFATHDTSLFDGEAKDAVLRRDQIYFTEKDNNGAARLYSLVEFKERANHNLRKRYLEGRYGALPAIGRLGD